MLPVLLLNCLVLPQVLFSRWLGQLKQGLLHDGDSSRWMADKAVLDQVPQRNMRSFKAEQQKLVMTN